MNCYSGALPSTPLKGSVLKDGMYLSPLQPIRPTTPPNGKTRLVPIPARIHKKRHDPIPGLLSPQQQGPSLPQPQQQRRITKPLDVTLRNVHDTTPPPSPVDDPNGYYIAEKGATFGDRYILQSQLGQGTFGKVLKAWDCQTSRFVAIKIIRAIPKYRNASRNELRALVALGNYDPANQSQCVRMLECFDYRNHVCIVTELLDISIYDFLKRNQFAPFPCTHVRSFAVQLLQSVEYLHSLGLVHTDLKPENILLHDASYTQDTWRRCARSNPRPRRKLCDTKVTLIDFGSAIFDDEYHAAVVSTRHYRAPEIIFGTGWTFSCDLWSIGCVLVELCTGTVLFQTRDNLTHLHMMERILEQRFDAKQLQQASRVKTGEDLINPFSNTLCPLIEAKQIQTLERQMDLRSLVRETGAYHESPLFWDYFLDLIEQMLCLDPTKRITASQALAHPWLSV